MTVIDVSAVVNAARFSIRHARILSLGLTLGGILCGPVTDRIGARRVFAACGALVAGPVHGVLTFFGWRAILWIGGGPLLLPPPSFRL